jgi:hypothetical protein
MSASLLDNDNAIALGLLALKAEPGAVVYADRQPRAPGPVLVGTEPVQAERPTLLAFRDELPGANWMHPCTYALIEIETRRVIATVPSDRPPTFGFLPDTWVVAGDHDGRADLIRADSPHP